MQKVVQCSEDMSGLLSFTCTSRFISLTTIIPSDEDFVRFGLLACSNSCDIIGRTGNGMNTSLNNRVAARLSLYVCRSTSHVSCPAVDVRNRTKH